MVKAYRGEVSMEWMLGVGCVITFILWEGLLRMLVFGELGAFLYAL